MKTSFFNLFALGFAVILMAAVVYIEAQRTDAGCSAEGGICKCKFVQY